VVAAAVVVALAAQMVRMCPAHHPSLIFDLPLGQCIAMSLHSQAAASTTATHQHYPFIAYKTKSPTSFSPPSPSSPALGAFYDGTDVVTLTDASFEDDVLSSDETWMLEVSRRWIWELYCAYFQLLCLVCVLILIKPVLE
jgi:hypothetical protein